MKKITLMACLMLSLASPASAQFNAFKDPVVGATPGAASGPDLAAVENTITGGAITVGATAYFVAKFKNPGTSPVKVTGINLYPSSTVTSEVTLNKCAEEELTPGAECAVTVSVAGLTAGAWRVEILLDHDGRTRLATAAVTGTVEGSKLEDDEVQADVEAVPEVLDFGSTTGGTPPVRAVLLRNRTQEVVKINDVMLDATAQSGLTFKSQCPESLKPGESCGVSISWAPLTKGAAQAVLNVLHSAKSSLTQVEIKGTFEPALNEKAKIYPEAVPEKGLLIADKDEIDFGDSIRGASAITVSLVNVGSEPVTLKNIKLSGSDSGVSIARSGCRAGTVLQPVEACPLTVNWVPSREGEVIDDLQVHHTGARGILLLAIRGEAEAAVSRETLAVRQYSSSADGGPSEDEGSISVTPVLDGYVVTSHSPTRAIINGPVGSIVVRDGEDVVISGVKWTVTIVSTGVILNSAQDEILLIFDKSLKPTVPVTTNSSSSSSNSNNNNSDSSSSSSDSSSSSTN